MRAWARLLVAGTLATVFALTSFACAKRDLSVAPGSMARSEILAVLRPVVERELDQGIRLEVEDLRANDRWAFVTAIPRTESGERIDYRTTKFATDWADGLLDDWICALLESKGAEWTVIALEIGPTDAPHIDWPERFGVPKVLVVP